jgi:hypothetical protein
MFFICFIYHININITITILDIVHRPVFYLKRDVSETGFCLRLQAEPTHLGPIVKATLCHRTPASQSQTQSHITTDGQSASLS